MKFAPAHGKRAKISCGRASPFSRLQATQATTRLRGVWVPPRATGKRTTLTEVGIYTVKNDKITREQFFYDGAH